MKDKLSLIENTKTNQFLYLGRWVDKKTFCAFVYDKNGQQQLAKTYDEFIQLTTSGIWFASKPQLKDRKSKDVVCANG